MKQQQTGQYTVITGASSGIGREAAKAFASRGSNLVLIARRGVLLDQLRDEILAASPQLDIITYTADLADAVEVHSIYDFVRRQQLPIRTWINNAGFGDYSSVADQNVDKMQRMLRLDMEAVATLSTLFVRDYKDVEGTQIINVSSAGGYTIVPNAVTYCAAKFFVSAFTEGMDRELQRSGARMRAKVFAPAATKTNFGCTASDTDTYDYDAHFPAYHTASQATQLLMELYDSDQTVGVVDRNTFIFTLRDPLFPNAG